MASTTKQQYKLLHKQQNKLPAVYNCVLLRAVNNYVKITVNHVDKYLLCFHV